MLTFFVLAISGGGSHGADKVFVSVKGYKMSLQEAVNNNYLKAGGSSPSDDLTTSISGGFHSLDEIFVSVSGSDMTLQQAISSGLCSSSSGSYSGNVILGHTGDELTLSSGKNLQQAINDGDYASWSPLTSTVCGGTSFIQTSNCGTTRKSNGGKCCVVPGPNCCSNNWQPIRHSICRGLWFTQTNECGEDRRMPGAAVGGECGDN